MERSHPLLCPFSDVIMSPNIPAAAPPNANAVSGPSPTEPRAAELALTLIVKPLTYDEDSRGDRGSGSGSGSPFPPPIMAPLTPAALISGRDPLHALARCTSTYDANSHSARVTRIARPGPSQEDTWREGLRQGFLTFSTGI